MAGSPIQTTGTRIEELQPVDMGLPLTPTASMPVMSNEDTMDNVYDSDCWLGHFLEAGVIKEANICMDEAPIQS